MNRANKKHPMTGLTLVEVIVLIVIAFCLVSILMPVLFGRHHKAASRMQCVNNLKQLGMAYLVLGQDKEHPMPAQALPSDYRSEGKPSNQSAEALLWTDYVIMANQLGHGSRILVCPADDRTPATRVTDIKDNSHLSYFAGVDGRNDYPNSFLGGDRNMAPGTEPQNDFGYSPKDGRGCFVSLATNSPVCWSLKMHSAGNKDGAGNLLLGDGSVQQVTSARLRAEYLAKAGVIPGKMPSENASSNAIPPGVRLLFP